MDDLIRMTAREAVRRLEAREISPLELIDAAERRVAAVDGAVNALPTRCFDRARAAARRLAATSCESGPGALHGLPIAIKDLTEVQGVRTTQGSPIFAAHIPSRSDDMVLRLEARGGIVVAKSNTPEFGAGSHTFNPVFGTTSNPWDTGKSAGGSSGGSAAALATGQVWLAQGSDLGGSLRNPASFCGVVGLRPSPGRVPYGPKAQPFDIGSQNGPMGRNVGDLALLLDAQVGAMASDPLSLAAPDRPFQDAATRPEDAAWRPRRAAFSPDLGLLPVDAEVRAICESAAKRLQEDGVAVELDCPDLTDAESIFQVQRAHSFATSRGALLEKHRDKMKPEVIWNIEKGLKLTSEDIRRAEQARGQLFHRVAAFFRRYDLLLCPVVGIPAFDKTLRYPGEMGGVELDTYISWMCHCFAITVTSCPAMSLPAGMTGSGLPVGLQIVGPPRGEHAVIAAGALLERRLEGASLLPIDPRAPT